MGLVVFVKFDDEDVVELLNEVYLDHKLELFILALHAEVGAPLIVHTQVIQNLDDVVVDGIRIAHGYCVEIERSSMHLHRLQRHFAVGLFGDRADAVSFAVFGIDQ